jgi:RNase P/RNase MRP subunit p29
MDVEILECSQAEKCGSAGLVLDESRNMLVIEQPQGEVKLPKQGTLLKCKLPADTSRPDELINIEIDCKQLIARPEDRVKKNEGKRKHK